MGFRVEMAPQPRSRETRKAQGEGTASPAAERSWVTIAQQSSSERIRHHQTTFLGDQTSWKVVGNREIQTICEIAVSYPLAIGTEVGDRGFDLDDRKITSLAEAEDVRPASVGEWKFDESSVAELVEHAANPSREEHGGH